MNKVELLGRLTRDPDYRGSEVGDNSSYCRFTVAVDRRYVKDRENQQTADFISCVCFGRTADFVNKYFHKGSPIALTGRIQTGKYVNKDGQTVYTTDVLAEEVEFVPRSNDGESEGNSNSGNYGARDASERRRDDFIDIPEGVDSELPFK